MSAVFHTLAALAVVASWWAIVLHNDTAYGQVFILFAIFFKLSAHNLDAFGDRR